MQHRIRHLSTYRYDPAAVHVALRLKLFPVDHEGQSVRDWLVMVNGEPVHPLILSGLGDREGMWSADEAHEEIEIIASGTVETRDMAGVVRGLSGNPPPAIYLGETGLTRPNKPIRKLAAEVQEGANEDPLAALHRLMAILNERVEYLSGSTNSTTTAAQALKAGKGVCQDHANLFIAVARAAGIPARYVTGYMQLEEETEELLETHAWAEAFVPTVGWIGFDPSNNLCPTDRYVRLCSGHDATAAAPIRGNVLGETTESLEVSVAIGHAQQ